MIAPEDETMLIGSQGVAHEMLLEEFTIPGGPLLSDDTSFHFLDQWAEECLSHALGKGIGGPFSKGGIRKLADGGVFPQKVRII